MESQLPDFGFPFEPYDVQVSFMKALCAALQESKIGIFESPTGTGKSLSVICGSLTWFAELKATRKSSLESGIEELAGQVDVPVGTDWVADSARKIELKNKLHELRLQYDKIIQRENKFQDLKRDRRCANLFIVEDTVDSVRQIISEVSDDEMLQDYESDDGEDSDEEEANEPKIIYCSRTHSQLSQFVKELKRTRHSETTRSVCLGSRQNMCINDAVKKLQTLNLMNEKCLEMQKKVVTRSPQRTKCCQNTCPFYKQHAMQVCSDKILTETKDIEDTVEMGKKMNACPYYSARYAVSEAELVVVPYNILFQKSTRKACNLKLKGSVVIVDEAHNLLETINASYSVQISGHILAQAHTLLNSYLTRYMSRLSVKNVMYIKQILHIVKVLVSYVSMLNETKAYRLPDFLIHLKLEQFNLFKIVRYFEQSRIALKLGTFDTNIDKSALGQFLATVKGAKTKPMDQVGNERLGAPLGVVQQFFRALTNPHCDGRLLCCGTGELSTSSIKYVHLNPASHFKDIVSESHAIILAGGTMQPTSEFVDQLLIPAGAEKNRVAHFSCGHVIPKSSLLASIVSRGPTSKNLEFSFRTRENPRMIEELGRVLVNICRIIPGGVVCFFPSYDYQMLVQDNWNKTGMLEKLRVKKKIFCEPRKASEVDKALTEYSQCIQRTQGSGVNGALLFSVVGGKMSEGINFSDDMGRCIIMVGMPYANIRSPEMEEKIAFLSKTFPRAPDGRPAGQVYYDNVCMKAVNQCIGRAIRHKGDYATILFLDHRYRRLAVTKALPAWIRDSLCQHDIFGSAFAEIRNFFANRHACN